MVRKPNIQGRELYRAIDEVLYYVWDPIGIANSPQSRDEYSSYLPQVLRLLQEGADQEAIAAHLGQITLTQMGCTIAAEKHTYAASLLCEWRDLLF